MSAEERGGRGGCSEIIEELEIGGEKKGTTDVIFLKGDQKTREGIL